MTAAALHYQSLREVAGRLAARELSPVEVTQALLQRIDLLNPELGAYYTVLREEAAAAAREAAAELAAGRPRGPLHGVPIAFKDIYAYGRTTAGSQLLRDSVPARPATAVTRAQAAGAVILGKLATHEFALSAATLSDPYPPARNPWDPELTPGGSSTGSGVAVAAGLAFGAYGTDTGGSVRMPAAHCGVVGFKPTYGLLSRAGIVPLAPSLDHAGALARTVADAALLCRAAAGPDPLDPTAGGDPAALEPPPAGAGLRGLRVGVPRDYFESSCESGVAERFEAALRRLEQLGATVADLRLGHSWADVIAVAYLILLPEAASHHLRHLRREPRGYGREFGLVLRTGLLEPAAAYVDAQRARRRIGQAADALFAACDLLALPTVGMAADPIPPGPRPLDRRLSERPAPQYTWLANLTGGPAVSVPCGLGPTGLPVGLQLVGRPHDDQRVLAAAAAYEAAAGWADLHPPRYP